MPDPFSVFAAAIQKNFAELSSGELLVVESPDIFDVYLAAFPEGTNPIYRVRTYHDCSMDKQFVRNLGKVVAPRNGSLKTVWDVPGLEYPYDVVAAAMAEHVRTQRILGVYRTKERQYGAESTLELRDEGTHRWFHFWGRVADKHYSTKSDEVRGRLNTTAQVFRRGLEELTVSACDTVLDLIDSNALYRGAEFRPAVSAFRDLIQRFNGLNSDEAKTLFVWENYDSPAARFRNTAMGTMVQDLSAGQDLEKCVRSFEAMVAPTNYKRPTALITQKMVTDALGTLRDLGLESAVERRFAKLSDVSVNNVLFVDNSVRGVMKDGLAGLLESAIKPAPLKVENAAPISMEDFVATVLPKAKQINVVLGGNHLSNFMSLTAPVHPDAGKLFKWNNGFAWSYDGEVTDSIKERVKRAGGKIDAPVRISLAWFNTDDLDLHVIEPSPGRHIYFGSKNPGDHLGRLLGNRFGGVLDVDMNVSSLVRDPVENVYWNGQMHNGRYEVYVNQFSKRESVDIGFTLEFEAFGKITQYAYDRAVAGNVVAFRFTMKDGQMTDVSVNTGVGVKEVGSRSGPSVEKWGVKTQTLVPVDTLLASPNHWDGQGVGNKHWLFVLKDCKNPEPTRGIYNEFLDSRLEPHRKVFEVLGAKTKCPVADEQLSGVGFSSTRKDKAVVVVKVGEAQRAYEINF